MRKTLIVVVTTFVFIVSFGAVYGEDIAIIVNKKNVTADVSFKEMVRISKAEKQFWADGKKIYLILPESGSREKDVALEKIYNMSETELKKFWLAKMFRGEISSFPKTLASNEAVKRFVAQVPNAIGFIAQDVADDTIKMLKIDGKLPEEKGYALKE